MQNRKLTGPTSRITIMLSGGGSGGHITPILSVAREIKQQNQQIRTVYVGLRGDRIGEKVQANSDIDDAYTIRAGKLRRYHGESLFKQLLDVRTQLLNLRDAIYILIGTIQAWYLLGKVRPDAIFAKGGFVVVPVAWAARLRGIPYGMHDSDTVPGLANRLIAKTALWQATGMPTSFYDYPKATARFTGIPHDHRFNILNDREWQKLRTKNNIGTTQLVVLIIGGGLGAQKLNRIAVEALTTVHKSLKDLKVYHIAGHADYANTYQDYEGRGWSKNDVEVIEYTDEVFTYSGLADIVITRAGATALSEFASQGKACIVVPSPYLSGGHQLKNAEYYKANDAIMVYQENDPTDILSSQLVELLRAKKKRQQLADSLHAMARPNAAKEIAILLVHTAKHEIIS